jgi:ATPase subunit of ABC transporter with duplicated ATPase domains
MISDLAYHYPNQNNLFERISFSVGKQRKVSVVGNNGVGKSTVLKLLAGELSPSEGSVMLSSRPYYVPQHTGSLHKTVADVLQISDKLKAMEAIIRGSVSQTDFDILADDWTVESRCESALAYWQLSHVKPGTSMDDLSGGEKTKVFLAGLLIHAPEIVLMDEPTNHLDTGSRQLLYRFIQQSPATMVIVSHDRTLLDQLDMMYELSEQGIRLYGGNYSFYAEQKEIEENALDDSIHAEEKTLRLARKKAQEVKQKQEKRQSKGEKNKQEVPRALKKLLTNSSENTAAKLKDKHSEIVGNSQNRLSELKQQKRALKELKIDFDNTSLHRGKLLIEANGMNFAYREGEPLWSRSLDFRLYSNDRIHICGGNGSGKTTFIKLLTGILPPSEGEIRCADFTWIYLDQDYSKVDVDCSVGELADRYNHNNLPEHEVKLRLNRFLFPSSAWDKSCKTLSGGEKMRLYLCCLMIGNQTPDLIILDEPTNNLDITNMQILTQTIRNYQGSLLLISHDRHFVNDVGVTAEVDISV